MSSAIPTVSSSAAEAAAKSQPEHIHRRFFVGPMPEKVITKKGRSDEDSARHIIKHFAFDFFVQSGGKPEEWDDNNESHIIREMLHKWRGTDWSQHLNGNNANSRWVGSSFEVGNILGLNVLQQPAPSSDRISTHSTTRPPLPTPSSALESFVTAPSDPPALQRLGLLGPPSIQSSPSSSNTPLLRPAISQPLVRQTAIQIPSFAKSEPPHNGAKGKVKQVHYADLPKPPTPGLTRQPSSRPASPTEVLEREGEEVEATSAGAMASPVDSDTIEWGDVIMRDRMYVRISSTEQQYVRQHFDEDQHRTMRGLKIEDQGEFLVVWRKNRIEIYRDYNIPGKEWVTGHKHLSFLIPLMPGSTDRPSKTKLSLYSFVDSTFCLIAAPTPTIVSKLRHFRHGEGSNFYIFKHKCRSRGFDWFWRIWRHLGGELPSMVDVWNPSLGTKVKMDVPGLDATQLYQMFARDNVTALCLQSLRSIADYKFIIEKGIEEGKVLELAWRMDTILDWVWLENDVYDDPRKWAVLYGLAVRNGHPLHLELRLGQHFPDYVTLRDGTHIQEPPAIEGYLDRIKTSGQGKQQLYLATHDGNLFIMNPARAFPPTPLGVKPAEQEDMENMGENMRQSEVRRGASQILGSTFVIDLRSILAVRRAFQVTVPLQHSEPEDEGEANTWAESIDQSASDGEDAGGDDGLARSSDRTNLKVKRSLELLLKDGDVIRLEAYSRKVALEWIQRLQALIRYWKHRHRIDAREEMDVAQSRRPRLTPVQRVHQDEEYPEPPSDPSSPMPALGTLFNWCVLQRCKPIIRGGKIYARKGLYGQFQLVHLFLIPGHLVHFAVRPKSPVHQTLNRVVSLVDAYVWSGYLAAQTLPRGQYNANSGAVPRRYQDGLETDDPEEDILFMLWYRPRTSPTNLLDDKAADAIPSLSSKKKLLVFRTRSKLERDAWCWALNSEIEKIARSQKEREMKLRDIGGLVNA